MEVKRGTGITWNNSVECERKYVQKRMKGKRKTTYGVVEMPQNGKRRKQNCVENNDTFWVYRQMKCIV
jgi:hypothetical protein